MMSDLVWFTADGKETEHESEDAAYGLTVADAEKQGMKFKPRAKQAERDLAAERRENMRLASLDGTEKPSKADPEPAKK
jgi:hypothetical protein